MAAIFGLTILIRWITKKNVSRAVIYSHGIFAVLGLILFFVFAMQNRGNYPNLALILFFIAACGGIYMFVRDLQKKMSPFFIAFAHALVALAGFVSLLLFAFS